MMWWLQTWAARKQREAQYAQPTRHPRLVLHHGAHGIVLIARGTQVTITALRITGGATRETITGTLTAPITDPTAVLKQIDRLTATMRGWNPVTGEGGIPRDVTEWCNHNTVH